MPQEKIVLKWGINDYRDCIEKNTINAILIVLLLLWEKWVKPTLIHYILVSKLASN